MGSLRYLCSTLLTLCFSNLPMTTNEIAHAIVGAAMEVHKLLGPGLLESAYEECLAREMVLRGIPFERQKPVPVVYKDVKLERGYRLDFLVDRHVVVELKSIGAVAPIHEAVILIYPRLSGKRFGLLINFNVAVLKDGIRRYVNPKFKRETQSEQRSSELTESLVPSLTRPMAH
jgi:GxxExxY protein